MIIHYFINFNVELIVHLLELLSNFNIQYINCLLDIIKDYFSCFHLFDFSFKLHQSSFMLYFYSFIFSVDYITIPNSFLFGISQPFLTHFIHLVNITFHLNESLVFFFHVVENLFSHHFYIF